MTKDHHLNRKRVKHLNRERVARHHQKQRDLGRVQRKRWAHPDDWPVIDRLIEKLNKEREL